MLKDPTLHNQFIDLGFNNGMTGLSTGENEDLHEIVVEFH
jgi:hypothetical protein